MGTIFTYDIKVPALSLGVSYIPTGTVLRVCLSVCVFAFLFVCCDGCVFAYLCACVCMCIDLYPLKKEKKCRFFLQA